jgi:ATP/maltotriose-dependent transcriptional regulator MalT
MLNAKLWLSNRPHEQHLTAPIVEATRHSGLANRRLVLDPTRGVIAPVALSAREREVLQLAAHDFSGPDIATFLRLSNGTVRTHFANIYIKLRVRSRAGAVAEGLRMHVIN